LAQARYLLANVLLIVVHQVPPPGIAQRCCASRRANDVDEQDRGEDTIHLGRRAYARHELLNLGEQIVDLAYPGDMILTRKLDVFGTWEPPKTCLGLSALVSVTPKKP
jgi:hypothetical protein